MVDRRRSRGRLRSRRGLTLKQARKALGRNAADEALVLLWHELEAARVAGDGRASRTIESLATRIAEQGDEAQQREADRLIGGRQ